MARSLKRLLQPRHVAVIGGHEAEACATQLQKFGFAGTIWPVNPRRDQMAGLSVYRDIESLPDAPDACFVGIDREKSVAVVAELAARGAGGVVCYASGFSETDEDDHAGARLQQALVDAAGEMPLLGPNCYGFINCADRALLWADQHGAAPLEAGAPGVAIVSQSSNLAINISMQRRGLPLAYLLTVGNQAQTGLSDLVAQMIDDDRVSTIGLYVEGIDDVRAFETVAARARALSKPIVALKAGRTALARAASVSHTASVAGSDAASTAFFDRLGIVQVQSLEVLIETLKLLHVVGPLPGPDVVSMSCSGGEACMAADGVRDTAIRLRPFSETAATRLRDVLGPLVNVANPLDYHTFIWAKREPLVRVFDAVTGDGFDLTMLLLDFPRPDRCEDADWWVSINAFADRLAHHQARGAVVSTLAENLPENTIHALHARGIAALGGLEHAMQAIDAAIGVRAAWQRASSLPVLTLNGNARSAQPLDEHAAKQLLEHHAVPVPHGDIASSVDAATACAQQIQYPVAVKALGIAHKTEQQALRLNIHDDATLRDATRALLGLSDTVRIERMVRSPVAELLVGVHREPPYGLLLTLASGGTLVERLNDRRSLLLPVTEREVRSALEDLIAGTLIAGYRNGTRGDGEATVSAILAIARFAEAYHHALTELDINPLIVCAEGAGAWAADALLVMEDLTR